MGVSEGGCTKTGVQERNEERNLCSEPESANRNNTSSPRRAGKKHGFSADKVIMSRHFSVSCQSTDGESSSNLKITPRADRLQI